MLNDLRRKYGGAGWFVKQLVIPFFLVLSLQLTGCALKIPDQLYVATGMAGSSEISSADSVCRESIPYAALAVAGPAEAGIDPGGFKLLNWNIYKGSQEGWAADFEKLIQDADIILLQEGYLAENLRNLLGNNDFYWVMAAAFDYRKITAGVLTAARIEPVFSCSFRNPEPLVRIPKTAMISVFSLTGSTKSLLVANIHMINFTLGSGAFRKQLETLARYIEGHAGPTIVTGDFNIWSNKRQKIVNGIFDRLKLQEIEFPGENRTTRFGHILDRIYYRDLDVYEAEAIKVTTSDHNPMQAGFRLAEDRSAYQ